MTMNWLNRLFWKIDCKVKSLSESIISDMAVLSFTHKLRNDKFTFTLSEREYIIYVNEPQTIIDKYFKEVLKRA